MVSNNLQMVDHGSLRKKIDGKTVNKLRWGEIYALAGRNVNKGPPYLWIPKRYKDSIL